MLKRFLWLRRWINQDCQACLAFITVLARGQLREVCDAFMAQFVNATVVRDVVEPALKRSLLVQGSKRNIKLEKYLLQNIAGLIVTAKYMNDVVKQMRAIAMDQLFKSQFVTFKRLSREYSIGQFWSRELCPV